MFWHRPGNWVLLYLSFMVLWGMASALQKPVPASEPSARKGDSPLLRILAKELEVRLFELDRPAPQKERLPSLAARNEAGPEGREPGSNNDREGRVEDMQDAETAQLFGTTQSAEEVPLTTIDPRPASTSSPSIDPAQSGSGDADIAPTATAEPTAGAAGSTPATTGAAGRAGESAIGPGQLSPSAGEELLTGKRSPAPLPAPRSAPTSSRTAPTSALAPPVAANPRQKDRDGNRLDDRLDAILRQMAEKKTAPQPIRILVTLSRPYRQDQLKAFNDLGGEVRHTFEAVRYGFSGLLPSNKMGDLAMRLGSDLLLIEPVLPVPGVTN